MRQGKGNMRKTLKEIFKVGNRYFNLTLLEIADDYISPKGRNHSMGLFLCDCGKIKPIRLSAVNSGMTKACGCMRGKLDFIREK